MHLLKNVPTHCCGCVILDSMYSQTFTVMLPIEEQTWTNTRGNQLMRSANFQYCQMAANLWKEIPINMDQNTTECVKQLQSSTDTTVSRCKAIISPLGLSFIRPVYLYKFRIAKRMMNAVAAHTCRC